MVCLFVVVVVDAGEVVEEEEGGLLWWRTRRLLTVKVYSGCGELVMLMVGDDGNESCCGI